MCILWMDKFSRWVKLDPWMATTVISFTKSERSEGLFNKLYADSPSRMIIQASGQLMKSVTLLVRHKQAYELSWPVGRDPSDAATVQCEREFIYQLLLQRVVGCVKSKNNTCRASQVFSGADSEKMWIHKLESLILLYQLDMIKIE